MTNGELFVKENPNIKTKINGSCVWIYYPDGVNHYTMPVEWWDKEISLFNKIKVEIDEQYDRVHPYNISCAEGLEMALEIIDKYKAEGSDKT